MSQDIHPLYSILFQTVPFKKHPVGRKITSFGPCMHQFADGKLPDRVLRYLAAFHTANCAKIAEGIDAAYGHTRTCLANLQKSGEIQCVQIHGSHPEYQLTKTDTA